MSQATYNKIWTNAQKDLDTQLQTEREQFLQPEKDRVKAFRMLSASYIEYLQIFHHLEEAHSHLIHQQKRAAIRQVLDGVIGRILEVKKEMVELENSEFHYTDNIIEDLKLLPEDTEIPIPKYFIKENLKGLQQREKTLDEILLNAGLATQKPVKAMTFEEAIKMIQVAERARQGRRRALFMKQIYLEEKRKRHTKLREQAGPNPDDAATCIQKVWRGYIQRKKTEKMREEEMIFLGMEFSHIIDVAITVRVAWNLYEHNLHQTRELFETHPSCSQAKQENKKGRAQLTHLLTFRRDFWITA